LDALALRGLRQEDRLDASGHALEGDGNGSAAGSASTPSALARNETAWYWPASATSSTSCSVVHSAASAAHSSSEIVAVSCSSSTIRTSSDSRSDHTGWAAAPLTVAARRSGVSPTPRTKTAACTPHSYSHPQRAQVRWITS